MPPPLRPASLLDHVHSVVENAHAAGQELENKLNNNLDGGQVALIALAAVLAAACAVSSAVCTRKRLQQRFDDEMGKMRYEMEMAKERKARWMAEIKAARGPSLLDEIRARREHAARRGQSTSPTSTEVEVKLHDDVERVFHVQAQAIASHSLAVPPQSSPVIPTPQTEEEIREAHWKSGGLIPVFAE